MSLMETLVAEIVSPAMTARLLGMGLFLAALVFLSSGVATFLFSEHRPTRIVTFATFMGLGTLCLFASISVFTTPTEELEPPAETGSSTSSPVVSDQSDTTESTP